MNKFFLRFLSVALLFLMCQGVLCAQEGNGIIGFAGYKDLGQTCVTGGGNGEIVHVSTYADFKRYVGSAEPYIVIVDANITGGGVKDLQDEITVASNKTIIGAGAGKLLDGISLVAKKAKNIILRNIYLRKGRIDGVSFQDVHHVWVDHCDFSESYDGVLDFTGGSDYLTVSWTKLHDHDKVSIINSGTCHFEDYGREHVTYAHCVFSNNVQRNPRIGYGKAHVYNCYWENISSYCIGVHSQAQVLSENNHFSASANNPFNNQYTSLLPYCGYITDKGSYFAKGNPGQNYQNPFTDITYTPLTYYNYDFDLNATNDVVTTTPKGVGPREGIQYEPILCPGNGAIEIPVTEKLSWGKVDGATAMKMYFGTSASNLTETTPEAVTLQPTTKYFWKVVAIVGGKEYPSPVYQFTTASEKATKPYPEEDMTNPWLRWPAVGEEFCTSMPLSWRQAADAVKYKVYLSTSEATLDNGFVGETPSLTINPGNLKLGVTYYWRVDVVKSSGAVVKGDTWKFSSPDVKVTEGKNEVEKMYLSGIVFHEATRSASGRNNTVGDQGPGAVLATWGGAEGRYAIETAIFNQTLGPNLYGVAVNNKYIDAWKSSDANDVIVTRKTRNTVYLKPGDEIRVDFIAGLVDGQMNSARARMDYITFTSTTSETVEVERAGRAYHEPKPTPGYDCEYLRLSQIIFKDTLGTVGDKNLMQVKDEYCSWVEKNDAGYKLLLKATAMVTAVYRNDSGVETEVTTEHDRTQNIEVTIAQATEGGQLYALKLYKKPPTPTSYYQPVADNGVYYQLIWSPDAIFVDSKGTKGEAGKVQVRDEYDGWMKYFNPTDNALQAKQNVPAFIDPKTDNAITNGMIPKGKDGNLYSYVVGTTKYMQLFLKGCERVQFYYTGTGGAATNVTVSVTNMDTEAREVFEGNEAPGKNVVSNSFAIRLDPTYHNAVKIEGSTGDMLIYAVKLWPGSSTGIENVNDEADGLSPLYNTVGQRVSENAKGILIRKGKKNIRR